MDWITNAYNYHTAADYLPMFLAGAWATIWIAFVCLLLSLPLGTILALMRMAKSGWLWRPVAAYTQFIRATPLLVQIFVIYHAIPLISPDPQLIGDTASGIVALTIHTTPYMAEIIRTGILSVGRGQMEAAMSVGMTKPQTLFYITLPQAFANIAPPLLGQMAVLVKDTSLLSTIAVFEVVSAGTMLMSERIAPNESFITITACYLLIYVVMLGVTNWVRGRVAGAAWVGR